MSDRPDMALQFSRIASHRPNGKEDWRLTCGPWRVGRVQENIKPVGSHTVFGWSLTGPNLPPDLMSNRGEADTLERDAKLGVSKGKTRSGKRQPRRDSKPRGTKQSVR